MSLVSITCPTDCTNYVPPVSFSFCDPDVEFGEIERIYITGHGNGLADWTSAAEWATRLDNDTEDDDTKIRTLYVSGDQPPAEANETEISLCRTVTSEKKFTVNFDIDETNITNNDAMRLVECGGMFTVWFATPNYMYGGTDGLSAKIDMNNNITRGCSELNLISGTAKWQAKHHPEKIANPLF